MTALYLLAQAQAAPGVTLSTGTLALLGLLVAALSALLAGGIAWGRFSAVIDQLRADHADLRADVKRAAEAGAQIAVLQQSVADLRARVELLGDRSHKAAADATRLATLVEGLAARMGHAEDDLRRSTSPSPR